MPQFYKPDPKNPAVYDAQGNFVSQEQYLAATGQTGKDPSQIDWSPIQNTPVPAQIDSASVWNLPGMQALKSQLSPADQAFSESLYKVTQEQITAGGVGTVDSDSYQKALQIASEDPSIKATYGDAAKTAAQDLAFSIGQITGNQETGQAALQATQLQQKQALEAQIATSGQAYSGFRKQAEDQLKTQQADVIQSTRSQLQQQIQQLGRGYESAYGSGFPGTPGSSSITAGGPVTGQVSYQPVGGIVGTQTYNQQQASQQTATDLGILPKVNAQGVLK